LEVDAGVDAGEGSSRCAGTGDALILKASRRSEMSFFVLMEPTRRRREEVDGLRERDGEGVADVDTEVAMVDMAPSLARH
jgi:hypothetical protein